MINLSLKWRPSDIDRRNSFLAYDPERFADEYVAGIRRTFRAEYNAPETWSWQFYLPPRLKYVAQLQTLNGMEDEPRAAAAAAEACYFRYVSLLTPEELVYELAFRQHGTAARAAWARKHGPQP